MEQEEALRRALPQQSWLVLIAPVGAEELRTEVLSDGGLVPRWDCCLQTSGEGGRV